MSLLVRKLAKSKWPKENFETVDIKDLRADAITSCLRTSNDTLSTWEIASPDNLSDAILALVSSFEKIDKIDVVMIEREEVVNRGFEIADTLGNTPVEQLKNTHKDITGLTYQTVGDFSRLLLDTMMEGRVERYTATKVKRLLKEAIEQGKLDLNSLKEGVRESLVS
ncbi:hypothetical protein ACQVPY_13750 [Bacillus pretiosus]|uniref:hypothetical protein n=1 Tax=Bacillus pretiosus TaxID=2983392 RepID=UPI003D64DAEB